MANLLVLDGVKASKYLKANGAGTDVDPHIPHHIVATAGTLTDRSGTVTTGGTSQQLAAANTDRRYLFIINLSNIVLWINFGTAAVADSPSIPLQAASADGAADGGSIVFEGTFVPTGAINIIGATTGKKFVAKEG